MDTQIIKKQFQIPTFKMPRFEERMTKMAKSAKKLGLKAPTFTIIETLPATYNIITGDVINHRRHVVEVDGEFPKLAGFTFVGTVEHTEIGNVLRSAPNQELSEDFRHISATCDHCQTKRDRKNTFVVLHDETKEFKRVGRACVKDFLGGMTPEMLAYSSQFVEELSGNDDEEYSGSGKRLIETLDFLAYAVMVVETEGRFVSSSKSRETGEASTSQTALSHFIKFLAKEAKYPSAQHHTKAVELLDWAQNLDAKGTFEQNMKIISHKRYLESRDLGLVAAITVAHMKHFELLNKKTAEVAKNKEESVSTHVGEIGKRMDFDVFVYKIMRFENDFGTMKYYLMRDAKGNEFVWKTGTGGSVNVEVKNGDETIRMFQDGISESESEPLKIKATVKKFDEYKGKKQTVLTRVSFYDLVIQEAA